MKSSLIIALVVSNSMIGNAAEWIVMTLQPRTEAAFIEITLPNGMEPSHLSANGVADNRSQSLKWGPLDPSLSAITFAIDSTSPDTTLSVSSWPSTATMTTSIVIAKDADGDGLSEALEDQLGTSDLDPTDANQDADRDGRSNLAETLAGSNPQSAQSQAAAGDASYHAESASLQVRLPKEIRVDGMTIETATNLAASDWETVSRWNVIDNGNDSETTIIIEGVSATSSPTRFFRFRWGR